MPSTYGSGATGNRPISSFDRRGIKARVFAHDDQPVGAVADPFLAEMTTRLNELEKTVRRVNMTDLAGVRYTKSTTRDVTVLATADATAQERRGADHVLPGAHDNKHIERWLELGDVKIIGTNVYRSDSITIPANRNLTAAGNRRVNLLWNEGSTVTGTGAIIANADNILVQGFNLVHGVGGATTGVHILGDYVRVVDCAISGGFTYGIESALADNCRVLVIEIEDCLGAAMYLDHGRDWFVDGVAIVQSTGSGLFLLQMDSSRFSNGEIHGGDTSIGLTDCHINQFIGWELEGFASNGIILDQDSEPNNEHHNQFIGISFQSYLATDENIHIFPGSDYNKFTNMTHVTAAVGEYQDGSGTAVWADIHDHSDERYGGQISHAFLLDTDSPTAHPQYALDSDVITDHGGLTGLGDNDHPHYLLAADVGQGEIITRGAAGISNLPAPSTTGHILQADTTLNRRFAWSPLSSTTPQPIGLPTIGTSNAPTRSGHVHGIETGTAIGTPTHDSTPFLNTALNLFTVRVNGLYRPIHSLVMLDDEFWTEEGREGWTVTPLPAGGSGYTHTESGHPGILVLYNSGIADGGLRVDLGAGGFVRAGKEWFAALVKWPDVTSNCHWDIGFSGGSGINTPTDAIGFRDASGSNIKGYCRAANSQTDSGSNYTPTDDTWYWLVAVINTTASVSFYVLDEDGDVVGSLGTVTTNIPTNATHPVLRYWGTTGTDWMMYVDYFGYGGALGRNMMKKT